MREIKFRIWDKVKLIYQDEINYIDFRHGYASVFDKYNYEDDCSKEIKINNIMQYTGRNDKNFKDIYEGDIVTTKNNGLGIVKYESISGAYIVEDVKTRVIHPLGLLSYRIEVIGNIYENPELLKK
jgi:uncharacterized phage protein (TIGR01671 family)